MALIFKIKNMGIQELLNSNRNVSITISAIELKEFANILIDEAVARFTPHEETYLTVFQASKRLGVDRSTLWRWDKENYLKTIKIGSKVRYRLSDIEKILEGQE